tara:strand:- start:147 stop:905 length:759 start_codon:yes stop_codon:yes gene_type:complete
MKNILYPTFLIALVFFSCGKTNENNESRIFLNFNHHCDNTALSNDGLTHTNEAGENYNVLTLKYIVTDIKLTSNNKDHEEIIIKDLHFVDFNDPSTMFIESDILENGSYTLSFRFGLDANTNIADNFTNETFHASMDWPPMIDPNTGMEMGGGYHYMKLEGAYNNDSTFYNTHTGPTMGMDHSFVVSFNMFNININNSTENLEYSIDMNVNNWYENPNTINLAPMIMMDMTKQMQLMANGMTDVFTIQGVLD